MTICQKVRNSYQQRFDEFCDNRIFFEPETVFEPANGRPCQACGSKAPKHLRLVEDISGERYYVGTECYFHMRKAFGEWPEVKRLGRPFELWIARNRNRFQFRPTFQLVDIYKEQILIEEKADG